VYAEKVAHSRGWVHLAELGLLYEVTARAPWPFKPLRARPPAGPSVLVARHSALDSGSTRHCLDPVVRVLLVWLQRGHSGYAKSLQVRACRCHLFDLAHLRLYTDRPRAALPRCRVHSGRDCLYCPQDRAGTDVQTHRNRCYKSPANGQPIN
jgi:hypothetical protein